jgi:hypothetical protein
MIGKAVTLSEALARSDRGPLPKIKEVMKGLADRTKFEKVTEDVENALEQMNREIEKSSEEESPNRPWWLRRRKTAEQRREDHFTKGVISIFSGSALMIFLYFLTSVLVLKLPPDVIAEVPFEIDPVVKVLWLIGLLPAMTGVGHIIAGLLIRPKRQPLLEPKTTAQLNEQPIDYSPPPMSVTERTTNFLRRP